MPESGEIWDQTEVIINHRTSAPPPPPPNSRDFFVLDICSFSFKNVSKCLFSRAQQISILKRLQRPLVINNILTPQTSAPLAEFSGSGPSQNGKLKTRKNNRSKPMKLRNENGIYVCCTN